MPLVLAFTWNDLVDLALAVFLLAIGISLGYAFWRLGGTFARLSAFIKGTQEELLPVINKTGGTVDRVNAQLDKVDLAAGVAHGAATLRVEHDVRSAVERGKEAAARRERELGDELRRVDEERP